MFQLKQPAGLGSLGLVAGDVGVSVHKTCVYGIITVYQTPRTRPQIADGQARRATRRIYAPVRGAAAAAPDTLSVPGLRPVNLLRSRRCLDNLCVYVVQRTNAPAPAPATSTNQQPHE